VPLHKAYFVTPEDKIRRETIMRVMCDLSLDFAAMSRKLGINFPQHFASELASLAPFEADGLVSRTAGGLEVTDAGRLFIRNIAMCFDNTLAPAMGERRHSRTINRVYKPVLDDAPWRSFDSTAAYRAWCEAHLPEYLGFHRSRP
jgi:oxygen-independent coproporphyrinogen III oxidase